MAELSNPQESSDGVEHALRQVCELIESAVSMRRDTPASSSPLVPATDGPAVRGAVSQLLARARHSVNLVLPGTYERARPLAPLLDQVADVAASGVTVRLLCTPQVLVPLGLLGPARRGTLGYEVRVTDADLPGTAIADGRISFGRSGPGGGHRYVTFNTDPASVRALDLMFAGLWSSATPVLDHVRLAERMRTEPVRRVLGRLREGHTDDVAAKQIRVSLRTYRRHVAAIMRDVGANSRFQAGVRAVELGLLADLD
ncbi:LuxR family transcriptional regulator [Streptomyces sp. B1866]|uniref:LuxR family transcriptional regulator n=1 Tax=Streptomyces sp. B1866 TaxID=3075431 RepID=UPI00288D8B72|nr:LuxR family transcriptional regulator [Streptomyces sp. B1866]MDT3399437.1 LuxR family transcriptional regulator [Streptomyces sp. B1866]